MATKFSSHLTLRGMSLGWLSLALTSSISETACSKAGCYIQRGEAEKHEAGFSKM